MSKFIINSFQLPNAVVDELLAELTGAELKCYLLILRKTKGWNKADAISTSQFMKACNLSNRKVIDACKKLVELGLLEQKNGARGIKVFSVKNSTCEESSPVKKVHSTCEESSQDLMKKVHTQNNTIQNNTIQNKSPLPPRGLADKNPHSAKAKVKVNFDDVLTSWNLVFGDTVIPNLIKLNDERKRKISKVADELISEFGNAEPRTFEDYFRDFLTQAKSRKDKFYFGGIAGDKWIADFDYIMRPKTLLKALENAL